MIAIEFKPRRGKGVGTLPFSFFTPQGVAESQSIAYAETNRRKNAGNMQLYEQQLANMRINAQAAGINSEYADWVNGKLVAVSAPPPPDLAFEEATTLYPLILAQNYLLDAPLHRYKDSATGDGYSDDWNWQSQRTPTALPVTPVAGNNTPGGNGTRTATTTPASSVNTGGSNPGQTNTISTGGSNTSPNSQQVVNPGGVDIEKLLEGDVMGVPMLLLLAGGAFLLFKGR